MSEICTPPEVGIDQDGDEWVMFGPHHSLADIARWIMTNPSEAEELRMLLENMLAGVDGMTMQ